MRILIDADGCPVVDITVLAAKENNIECIILCDTSHVFKKDGAQTITVSKGADSVDFALVNMIKPYDIVITQDYGLAAMCLAKRAITLSQDGKIYDDSNIDSLLFARHHSRKIRNAGGRTKGPSKRTPRQDERFKQTLLSLIKQE
ncbi:MAG TPA: YaiI/YqxD family protein [Clostridia bacterium]|nr:YaiI/YqxD family protein [Clostridia bacterium]